MDRFIRIAAYVCNLGLVILAILILANSHRSQELFFATCAIIPALINLAALSLGPNLVERRLARRLNIARMQDELAKLETKK